MSSRTQQQSREDLIKIFSRLKVKAEREVAVIGIVDLILRLFEDRNIKRPAKFSPMSPLVLKELSEYSRKLADLAKFAKRIRQQDIPAINDIWIAQELPECLAAIADQLAQTVSLEKEKPEVEALRKGGRPRNVVPELIANILCEAYQNLTESTPTLTEASSANGSYGYMSLVYDVFETGKVRGDPEYCARQAHLVKYPRTEPETNSEKSKQAKEINPQETSQNLSTEETQLKELKLLQ